MRASKVWPDCHGARDIPGHSLVILPPPPPHGAWLLRAEGFGYLLFNISVLPLHKAEFPGIQGREGLPRAMVVGISQVVLFPSPRSLRLTAQMPCCCLSPFPGSFLSQRIPRAHSTVLPASACVTILRLPQCNGWAGVRDCALASDQLCCSCSRSLILLSFSLPLFSVAVLLRYNLHTTQFTHLKHSMTFSIRLPKKSVCFFL